ncbi:MAG: dockerin type I repeat-containing protein, partial [Armatimonadota bacterium]
ETPPGTVYRLDIELIVLNDGNGNSIKDKVTLQGGALGVVSPHRLYIDGGSPKLPDRETWISISYESDTDAKLSAAVIGISVVPENPTLPLPQFIGAIAGQAAPNSGVAFVQVSPSSAIVRIESRGQPIEEGAVAHVRIRTPSDIVRRASYRLSLSQVRLYDSRGAELIPTLLPGLLRVALLTGDVNADGRVDIMDAGLCLRYALGLLTPSQTLFQRADIEPKRAENLYGDGVVNISDVLRMLRIALGFDEGY